MGSLEQRGALDALIRRVQQAMAGEWPSEGGMRHPGLVPSPSLVAALAVAEQANDSGVDVDAALVELQAAWEPPAPEPEA